MERGNVAVTNAQQLRCVGQAIEAAGLEDFDIEVQEGQYVVYAPNRHDCRGSPIHLGSKDLMRLELEGRARRRDGNRVPDYYQPSHILRAVGAILDGRRERLCQLSKRGPRVTFQVQTPFGEQRAEEYTLALLYELSLRLYMQRAKAS
jgi:hypothetical protein